MQPSEKPVGKCLRYNPFQKAQIASVIAFLASEGANHITGQLIHVDGGDSMGRLAPIQVAATN